MINERPPFKALTIRIPIIIIPIQGSYYHRRFLVVLEVKLRFPERV